MDKIGTYSREDIITLLKQRKEFSRPDTEVSDNKITEQEISVLLNELQIFQLELEIQNDELKTSYKMLEAERSKLSGFFNQAPVGYFILDNLGFIEEANQTGSELFSVQKSELLGKRFIDLISPEEVESFFNFLHVAESSSARQFLEVKMDYNQVNFYARIEGVAISNVFSKKINYYLTVVDVTESKEAQRQLTDTSERLTMTLKASSTGTWTMKLGENKLFLDDYSYQILGISPIGFDAKIDSFIELISPEDQAKVRLGFVNAANQRNKIDLEFKISGKGGSTKVIYVQGHEIENLQERNYFAGILMDITEKKRHEALTENARAENQRLILSATLNAQEKERSRISIALHDSVCQILYGIRINLQSLQRANQTSAAQFSNVNHLLAEAIRETREISYELTPSVLRDFGFTAGIHEMAQRLSVPGFKLTANIETELNFFDQDKQLYVFRIIQELINNCIKHAEASQAVIHIFSQDGWLNVVFSDNGKGFDYQETKTVLKGSGLRSIKNRIFLLNGEMKVDSSPKGSKISIKIKYLNESTE